MLNCSLFPLNRNLTDHWENDLMSKQLSTYCVAAMALLIGICVMHSAALAQAPTPYGAPISLEQANHVIKAAQAEAEKNGWPVAIAVVDGSGFLVAFQRLENTQLGSVEVSIEKAKTSALFRRPTKVFEETLGTGGANVKVLKLPGALPIEGGLPIVQEGKIIGAIGVSGVKSSEDGQIAAAGIAVLAIP
jgi:glc operon protein GlcG